MPPTTTTERLADYETRYRELAAELAGIGLIHSGSVTRRYTRCATPGCKCHADPPQPHGPYYQWTAKVNGKTVTRRLTKTQASLYQEWIDNDRDSDGSSNRCDTSPPKPPRSNSRTQPTHSTDHASSQDPHTQPAPTDAQPGKPPHTRRFPGRPNSPK